MLRGRRLSPSHPGQHGDFVMSFVMSFVCKGDGLILCPHLKNNSATNSQFAWFQGLLLFSKDQN